MVNWNTLEITSTAIRSVFQHVKDVTYEIILIDNGSTKDESTKELPARFPHVKFIANGKNLGFSKANNQGTTVARGRFVLLLNSDTVQIENAIGKSVAYMDAHAEVGALGVLHLNNDAAHTVQPSAFEFPRPLNEIEGLLKFSSDYQPQLPDKTLVEEKDVDWIVGSYLFMRRECLIQVGELDERFFVYDEDIDWCKRTQAAGWKIRFWSGASMVHIGSATHPHIKDKTFMHFSSHLTYIHKHHTFFVAALYYMVMNVRLGMATARQLLRLLTGKTTPADLHERYQRQLQFLLLRSSRAGV